MGKHASKRPRHRRFTWVVINAFCAVILAGSAPRAQASFGEATTELLTSEAAAHILEEFGMSELAGHSSGYDLFRVGGGTYLRDARALHVWQLRGDSLDHAFTEILPEGGDELRVHEAGAFQGRWGAWSQPELPIVIRSSQANASFVAKMFVSMAGDSVLGAPLGGKYNQLALRAEQAQWLEVFRARLDSTRFDPAALDILVHDDDPVVFETLRRIPGAQVHPIAVQRSEKIVEFIRNQKPGRMTVLISHNANGFYRYPGKSSGGIDIDTVDKAIAGSRGGTLVASCDAGTATASSGPVSPIHEREFASLLLKASAALSYGDFALGLDHALVLDKSFLPEEIPFVEKPANLDEAREQFLHPSVPRASVLATAIGPAPDLDSGARPASSTQANRPWTLASDATSPVAENASPGSRETVPTGRPADSHLVLFVTAAVSSLVVFIAVFRNSLRARK